MSVFTDGSNHSSLGGFNRRLSTGPKPSLSIHVDNHYQAKVYTTSSSVSGRIKINTSRDVRFDHVEILFLGVSKTVVETSFSPHAINHTFLRLSMPLSQLEDSFPVPRVFEAGRTYTAPFHFVVPQHLTMSACRHGLESGPVHQDHLCLPPTMGRWEGKDDLSPEMSHVEYNIKARVYRDEEVSGKRIKVMEAAQEINVLPAFSERAPLNVTKNDKLYSMSKSKMLRKSLLTSKLGVMTLSATQPRAVMMKTDGRSASSTDAMLDLKFEPASSNSVPPKVTGISAKITTVTYFSSAGIKVAPNLGDWNRSFDSNGPGSYSNTMSISSAEATNNKVTWQQKLSPQARRDSGYATDENSDNSRSSSDGGDRRRGSKASNKYKSAPFYYAANLQVPIKLPTSKKMFIPSFHSCITSRAYALQVTVSLSAGGMSSSLSVSVPLQVGVDTTEADVDSTGLPTFEAAVGLVDVDEPLGPRSMFPPRMEFERHQLPGYSDGLVAVRS
ncbi:arrestin [Pseudomassariella vexata]|uniref:Arrestin n=1 Tax=Pseudomassariella vexata TaxID=1141098 RepID=A0A1Y2E158_9PEZI|nr:arrestin [Pseudomassariella vexata]ORY65268.1 arrestin [Pseudomassariella vexata]